MIKVIIADDHAILRQALSEMLTSHGKFYVVGQAGSGEELLKLLEHETPDAAIVDLGMPGMNGIEAIERINALGKKFPVLVLSADEHPRTVKSALRAGAKGFIPKNAAVQELEFALTAIANGNTYLSPTVTAAVMRDDAPEIDVSNPVSRLSKREVEILRHLADGRPNREIAKLLHISIRTVDTHRSNILKKLDAKTNAEMVKIAIAARLVTI